MDARTHAAKHARACMYIAVLQEYTDELLTRNADRDKRTRRAMCAGRRAHATMTRNCPNSEGRLAAEQLVREET